MTNNHTIKGAMCYNSRGPDPTRLSGAIVRYQQHVVVYVE